MDFWFANRRFLPGVFVCGLVLAAAGCRATDDKQASGIDYIAAGKERTEEPVLMSELVGYCPRVELREGTAYYNTYQRGGDQDPEKVIYQASITDVTRTCSQANGMLTMNVAVAGRVVPGPAGSAGTVAMPIRVAAVSGDQVLYSQIHKHEVAVGDAATQFIFNDTAVSFPIPAEKNVIVYAGYDEGPPKARQ
jgi:hypothetical protein